MRVLDFLCRDIYAFHSFMPLMCILQCRKLEVAHGQGGETLSVILHYTMDAALNLTSAKSSSLFVPFDYWDIIVCLQFHVERNIER